ncbi:hypothetical protein TcCL_Unassigned05654, partial [Trypanosoma cruzi]
HLVVHQHYHQTIPPPHQNRTTARRGHTPAAHGQPSSSPSLLSLACSLQHKRTPRQRKKQKGRQVTQPRTVPSSNESHKWQCTHHEAVGISTIAELTQHLANQNLKMQ